MDGDDLRPGPGDKMIVFGRHLARVVEFHGFDCESSVRCQLVPNLFGPSPEPPPDHFVLNPAQSLGFGEEMCSTLPPAGEWVATCPKPAVVVPDPVSPRSLDVEPCIGQCGLQFRPVDQQLEGSVEYRSAAEVADAWPDGRRRR